MKSFFAVLLSAVCLIAHAADVSTPVTKITEIYAYADFGNGDVAVRVAQATTGCESGFYLTKSDPGFGAMYALILSAKASQADVILYGKSDQIWAGSAGKFCKLSTAKVQ